MEVGESLLSYYRQKKVTLEAKLTYLKRGKEPEAIRKENELRRAKGELKFKELEARGCLERDEKVGRVYYDAFTMCIDLKPPNPMFRFGRVFDEKGNLLQENARVRVPLRESSNFFPRDYVYVEPSVRHPGDYELVGKYNWKGRRVG